MREGKAFEFWERVEKARVKSRRRGVEEEGEGLREFISFFFRAWGEMKRKKN